MKKTNAKKKPLVVAPQTIRVLTTELASVGGGCTVPSVCSSPRSGCQDAD